MLSNPHGIATFFALTPEETQTIVPIARALIGNRSAVVLKTSQGDVQSRTIPAGRIFISGEKRSGEADVAKGAQAIMQVMNTCAPVRDIRGEAGTHAGGMLERVRKVMASLSGHNMSNTYPGSASCRYLYSSQSAAAVSRGIFDGKRRRYCGDGELDRLQMQAIATNWSAAEYSC